jgi:hypothetical protein
VRSPQYGLNSRFFKPQSRFRRSDVPAGHLKLGIEPAACLLLCSPFLLMDKFTYMYDIQYSLCVPLTVKN